MERDSHLQEGKPHNGSISVFKRKSSVFAILGIGVILIAHLIGTFLERAYGPMSPEKLERELAKAAEAINASVPIVMDTATTITGASADSKSFTYFVDISVPVADAEIPQFKAQSTELASQTICGQRGLKTFVSSGAVFTYRMKLPSDRTVDIEINHCR